MREHLSQPKSRRAVIALTLLTIMWGTTFIVVKDALPDVSPILFAAIRFAIALIIFIGVFPAGRTAVRVLFAPRNPDERVLQRNSMVLGITLGIGYIFQFVGLMTTTTSKAAFLTSTTVLWTPLFSHYLGHEMLNSRKIITVVAASVGIVLLTHPFPIRQMVIGDLYCALCAVSFGLYILWLDKTSPLAAKIAKTDTDAAVLLSVMQLSVALGVMLLVMPFAETPHLHLSTDAIFAILYTAIFATAISSYVQSYYQKEITPTSATLIYTLEPVTTALIGFILVGEHMSAIEFDGCGLIIAAMLVGTVFGSSTPTK